MQTTATMALKKPEEIFFQEIRDLNGGKYAPLSEVRKVVKRYYERQHENRENVSRLVPSVV